MAPPKTSRAHDEAKGEGTHAEKKNGGGTGSAKMRRITSQTGSAASHREAANAPTSAPPVVEPIAPGLDWRSFDRSALHAYRRELHLATPNSFVSTYHHWVLSSPNGIGKHSPTMVRRKQARRQTKEQLATTVRKHFNGVGIQENDVIVDFIYKVHSDKAEKASESHKTGSNPT
ncbi:hypothetical protein NLU13_0656 [Sarocladium strictum]|uniref:Histone deacetylase complex subunit SAP30 Sin3 binding domain-containing protein n=1 Tax=Sarocladium strictum TaxID=5046 RepID=A0AA39GPG5_SARSR|nr:hypothetical protein NLU13_0656 [Sarocladium strictum]